MNSEEITSIQLNKLEQFLKKCDYSKEELFVALQLQLERENNIAEDWIKESKTKIRDVIDYFLQENNLDWLISMIAHDLFNKYEKTISQGQAEAVLRRVLGISLSSTERSQLYELRKKIRRYEKFVSHFGEWDVPDYLFKIIIMGLSAEQATKLIQISPLKEISGSRLAIGVDFIPKPIKISDKRVKLQLWNMSTEKRFNFLISQYCRGAHGAIIVYEKSDGDSFGSAKEYYKVIKKETDLKFKMKERPYSFVDMPVILVGLGDGKIVSAEEGQSIVKEWGASGYVEISEIDVQNFENILSSLSLGIITNYQNALKRSPRKLRY